MLRIAVVGTGGISHAHIKAYLQYPERCIIVALVDIIPGKAQRVKEQYHLDADVYLDHHQILDKDIDLVDVCTPPFVHAEITINALKNGKNVVCEKPMAASLEECDAVLRARDESGKKLSIIAQNRFRKPIRDLKALLDSGMAGKVRQVTVNSLWFRGHSYYDLWWRGTWETEGGGCTLNHAVHIATVTASVISHGEDQELIFQCEKAKLAFPYSVFASQPQPNGFPLTEPDKAFEKEAEDYLSALPPLEYEMHDGQLNDVLCALEEDREPAITGEDGRRTIELITAIYKAGSTKTTVTLPLTKDDPFYTVEGIRAHVPHFYEKTASVENLEGELSFGNFRKGESK